MSIDQIVQLYNLGYRLEDANYRLNYLQDALIFYVHTDSIPPVPLEDAHIIINNIDHGVTDNTGHLTINGLAPGKINFIVTKLTFKDLPGTATAGQHQQVDIALEAATDFSASLKFVVKEPGTTTQVPSFGSHIILDNQEFPDVTNKYGILLVPNLAINTTIPFLVNKPGFPESFGIANVGDHGTTTTINVNLGLFPTRTLAIMRTALIGAIFLTSIGIIGNYLMTHFLDIKLKQQSKYESK